MRGRNWRFGNKKHLPELGRCFWYWGMDCHVGLRPPRNDGGDSGVIARSEATRWLWKANGTSRTPSPTKRSVGDDVLGVPWGSGGLQESRFGSANLPYADLGVCARDCHVGLRPPRNDGGDSGVIARSEATRQSVSLYQRDVEDAVPYELYQISATKRVKYIAAAMGRGSQGCTQEGLDF